MGCLCDFHGMSLTRDKLCSLIKKKKTLIEGWTDVKTTDGYTVRLFCITFTKREKRPQDDGRNFPAAYCQTSNIRKIRKNMVKVIQTKVAKAPLRELVKELIPDSISREIEKICQPLNVPLENTMIRK